MTSLARTILISIALTLAACGESSTPKIEKAQYLLVLKTLDNSFFSEIRSGFEKAIGGNGVVIVRAGRNESDIEAQLNALRSFAPDTLEGKLIKGVAITPVSSGSELVADLARFRKAGISVVLVDTIIPEEVFSKSGFGYNVGISSDNAEGGQKAAELLLSSLSSIKKPTILMLEGMSSSDTAQQRRLGFDRGIEAFKLRTGSPIDVTYRSANWRRDDANRMVAALLGSETTIDGIFAANDEMALGAISAFRSVGRKIPVVVGFDAVPDAIKEVQAGAMAGTIGQDANKMGVRAAELLLASGTAEKSNVLERIGVTVCTPNCK